MKLRGGEFSTGTTGNFQPELTVACSSMLQLPQPEFTSAHNRNPSENCVLGARCPVTGQELAVLQPPPLTYVLRSCLSLRVLSWRNTWRNAIWCC